MLYTCRRTILAEGWTVWKCENCNHLNRDESQVCEHCGMSKVESERRRIQRESEEEMEQTESDMWDEDQGLM